MQRVKCWTGLALSWNKFQQLGGCGTVDFVLSKFAKKISCPGMDCCCSSVRAIKNAGLSVTRSVVVWQTHIHAYGLFVIEAEFWGCFVVLFLPLVRGGAQQDLQCKCDITAWAKRMAARSNWQTCRCIVPAMLDNENAHRTLTNRTFLPHSPCLYFATQLCPQSSHAKPFSYDSY